MITTEAKRHQLIHQDCVSAAAMMEIFSLDESVRLVYIPIVLSDAILDYVSMACDVGAREKLSQYKKHTRALRACVSEYKYQLGKGADHAMLEHLNGQINKFWDLADYDVLRLYYAINGELKKEYPKKSEYEFMTYIHLAISLIAIIDKFTDKYEKLWRERTGWAREKEENFCFASIRKICQIIAKDCPIDRDNITKLAMDIIEIRIKAIDFSVSD